MTSSRCRLGIRSSGLTRTTVRNAMGCCHEIFSEHDETRNHDLQISKIPISSRYFPIHSLIYRLSIDILDWCFGTFFQFTIQLGISSSQLTHIFSEGQVETTSRDAGLSGLGPCQCGCNWEGKWIRCTHLDEARYYDWLVVWRIFHFSIQWEKSSQLTNIFQSG